MRIYKIISLLLLLSCAFLILEGCGQKGDLYLPDEEKENRL